MTNTLGKKFLKFGPINMVNKYSSRESSCRGSVSRNWNLRFSFDSNPNRFCYVGFMNVWEHMRWKHLVQY